jgi:calcium-dependent protein kinase
MLLTNSEVEKMTHLFLTLDTSNDGFLSLSELEQGMNQIMGSSHFEMKTLIADMDSNQDGKIDFQEFIAAAIKKEIALQKEHLETAFKLIDKDGDRKICKKEFLDVFTDVHDELWLQFLADVDKDNDGLISYDEFFESMTTVIRRNSKEVVRRNS